LLTVDKFAALMWWKFVMVPVAAQREARGPWPPVFYWTPLAPFELRDQDKNRPYYTVL